MGNDTENLAQKSALFEKKIALQRSKAAKKLGSNLSEIGLTSVKVLSHAASEGTHKTALGLSVWRQDFREKCERLFDFDDIEREKVFNRLKQAISALSSGAVFVFGNDWENHGAFIIDTNSIGDRIAELSFLMSDSFTIIDEACENGLRFEADEIGGRFSVAEAYVFGSDWVRMLKNQLEIVA